MEELPNSPSSMHGVRLEIIHPLSPKLNAVITARYDTMLEQYSSVTFLEVLVEILEAGHVIHKGKHSIVNFCADIVTKTVDSDDDFTEYTSLRYLQRNKPEFPAPRPHGLLNYDGKNVLFMSFVPGAVLSHVWHHLNMEQKNDISEELEDIFVSLRELHRPENKALGGIGGEGCKAHVRGVVRTSQSAMSNSVDFALFRLAEASIKKVGLYDLLLIEEANQGYCKYVFTLGSFSMGNVMVKRREYDTFNGTELIRWKMSGFYPEDWECSSRDKEGLGDGSWRFGPPCISSSKYPVG